MFTYKINKFPITFISREDVATISPSLYSTKKNENKINVDFPLENCSLDTGDNKFTSVARYKSGYSTGMFVIYFLVNKNTMPAINTNIENKDIGIKTRIDFINSPLGHMIGRLWVLFSYKRRQVEISVFKPYKELKFIITKYLSEKPYYFREEIGIDQFYPDYNFEIEELYNKGIMIVESVVGDEIIFKEFDEEIEYE